WFPPRPVHSAAWFTLYLVSVRPPQRVAAQHLDHPLFVRYPNSSIPWLVATSILFRAISKNASSCSMPINFIPALWQATPVVPEPIKGSSIVAPLGKAEVCIIL